QTQHPAFNQAWAKIHQTIQNFPHFSKTFKEGALWINAVLESYDKLLAPMKDIIQAYPQLQPALETVAGQWIQFLFVGGDSQALESPELFSAIKEFYHT